ncbi:MAG: V-type ATP synthase subunit A [Candidatus Atribacteria bacterium]|nr:V-type ATP synthase subunit A [Candidatus Atribacteria bacterium]
MKTAKITKVAGPVVAAKGLKNAKMYDVVKVSSQKLIGEIIELSKDSATIQVYEETSGIGPGESVFSTDMPLSVELGPGLISSIYDGIQRPLDILKSTKGDFITRGAEEFAIDRKKKWDFEPISKKGDKVISGDIIGTVQESSIVKHKIMVPYGIQGEIKEIYKDKFTVTDTIALIKDREGSIQEIKMLQKWPVRRPRPYKKKLPPLEPLITGQRIIDMFFPITKGGTACIPGPFGSGKTVVQHQISKWCNAEIILFIGCGERGNEMTDVLLEFPELIDPYSGKPLMERTILIANTSNMPVAAREASVYTGITIAEYYRDMGYNVALIADSTSRWAEAMREISGRLEEMPGEEGFPAYLGTRISSFYERSGRIKCLGSDDKEGTLSIVGAVSPPGGDLSEPVTQNTLRTVQVFWSLQDKLAYKRHFPAIDWLTSYSLYLSGLSEYYKKEIGEEYMEIRDKSMALLQEEAELEEIVRLVGVDALSTHEKLILETARSIREDFLLQDAFDITDSYSSTKKQFLILKLIIMFHENAKKVIENGVTIEKLSALPIKAKIIRAKYIEEKNLKAFSEIEKEIISQVNSTTN